MARTPREVNWELVEKGMEAGCTAAEISGKCGLSVDQFYRRFEDEFNIKFSEYAAKSYSAGDFDLKLTVHLKALKGIPSVLIRYCEERLGWGILKDKLPANQQELDKDHIIIQQAYEIAQLKANANKPETESEFLRSDTQI